MTNISTIWEAKNTASTLEPIELIAYINPITGEDRSTTTKSSHYDNIVRLRGRQDCIVMCWRGEGNHDDNRDIFLARWNDGVV